MSKESYFIGCAEVAELVGCGKSRAYKYIQQMNRELEARGNLTFPGRVPRRYAMERFGLLGEEPEELRLYLEWDFCSRCLREWFSLSNCDMTTAREFITYLIQFCFHWGVPTKDSLLTQTDDIGKYLYLCLENRRCAICNQPAEVHHVDRVGMGRDREAIVHIGLNAIALCRRHHEEAHRREKAMFADYHIYGIKLDRHLCKVLSLNQKPKGEVERGE